MDKNVFKEIEPKEKLPKEVKENVLKSIESLKLAMDFWDLMAVKRVKMNLKMVDQQNINNQNNNQEELNNEEE